MSRWNNIQKYLVLQTMQLHLRLYLLPIKIILYNINVLLLKVMLNYHRVFFCVNVQENNPISVSFAHLRARTASPIFWVSKSRMCFIRDFSLYCPSLLYSHTSKTWLEQQKPIQLVPLSLPLTSFFIWVSSHYLKLYKIKLFLL